MKLPQFTEKTILNVSVIKLPYLIKTWHNVSWYNSYVWGMLQLFNRLKIDLYWAHSIYKSCTTIALLVQKVELV